MPEHRRQSLIGAAAIGALAGVAATAVMSVVMLLGQRSGLFGEQPPRTITDQLLNRISPLAARNERHELAVAAHFGFGMSVGAAFGTLRRLLPELPGRATGALYGLAIYLVSYAGWLPALRLMPAPDRDKPARQPALIAAHLLYGLTLGILTRRLRRHLRAAA